MSGSTAEARSHLARIFHTFDAAIISTAASAPCKKVLALHELFQQLAPGEKRLKRLVGRFLRWHRAKATVLMKARVLRHEMSRLAPLP
jgi:hypothetical protein